MSLEVKKIWTKSITNSTLTIDGNYGLTVLSIVLQSGSGTVSGNLMTINGVNSTPLNLTVGQAITINTGTSSSLLTGITITTTGTVAIIGR
jgi:hypothetical protein